eukprot:s4758_g5.t1
MVSTETVNSASRPLDLEVLGNTGLGPLERSAYERVPAPMLQESRNSPRVLFACVPSGNEEALCAEDTPISVQALSKVLTRSSGPTSFGLRVEASCPVLVAPSSTIVIGKAQRTSGGMTSQEIYSILQNQGYYSTFFGSALPPPFNATNTSVAEHVGFLSLPPTGVGIWGLRCPDGAVVSVSAQTQPHCLHINAGEEQVLLDMVGSAACPPGSAVSGWYNLPGQPVKHLNDFGGPSSFQGFQLFCRKTALLAACQQAMNSFCHVGEIVNGLRYSKDSFKVSCCKLQKHLGLELLAERRDRQYQAFEGYYCPTAVGDTGAAIYERAAIKSLGELSRSSADKWRLSWNKFQAVWELRQLGGAASTEPLLLESSQVSPAGLQGENFSVTAIQELAASYLMQSNPQGPIPEEEPKYPKLQEFQPSQPDYAEFCDPVFLQMPSLYPGSIEESNPCYHTFNAEPPVKGMDKGITEQDFWSCSQRERMRSYMDQTAAATKLDYDGQLAKYDFEWQKQKDIMDLTAALLSAIPWGNFGLSAKAAVDKAEQEAKDLQEVVQSGEHAKSYRRIAWLQERLWSAEGQDPTKFTTKHIALNAVGAGFWNLAKDAAFDWNYWNPAVSIGMRNEKLAKFHTVVPTAAEKSLENISRELRDKTIPKLQAPSTFSTMGPNLREMRNTAWQDCMPLQFGLSKVMCDLFCVQDSVRQGTSAVLESLKSSHDVLMANIQALLDYHTKYILWAINQEAQRSRLLQAVDGQEEANGTLLSVPEMLEELRNPYLTQLKDEIQGIDSATLHRDILDWHKDAGQDLYDRMALVSFNVSAESWPYRVKSMRGMLQHFRRSLRGRLSAQRNVKPSAIAEKQLSAKIELLRQQSAEHRSRTSEAKSLRMQMTRPISAGSEVLWTSLLESFLRSHEKHGVFTMMRLRALDHTDDALKLAQNFSQCGGADTAALQNSWQTVQLAEERGAEVLLEAWAATVTTAERLQIALEDENFIANVIEGVELQHGMDAKLREHCTNFKEISQQLFGHAIQAVDRALKPLLMQILTFQAVRNFQEQELKSRRSDYIPAPQISFADLTIRLAAIGDPTQAPGRALATRALNHLGSRACPAPNGCPQGMLLGRESGWSIPEPGSFLFGEASGATACNMDGETSTPPEQNISLGTEALPNLLLLEAAKVLQ